MTQALGNQCCLEGEGPRKGKVKRRGRAGGRGRARSKGERLEKGAVTAELSHSVSCYHRKQIQCGQV